MFDQLPLKIQGYLEDNNFHETMSGGAKLLFYDTLGLLTHVTQKWTRLFETWLSGRTQLLSSANKQDVFEVCSSTRCTTSEQCMATWKLMVPPRIKTAIPGRATIKIFYKHNKKTNWKASGHFQFKLARSCRESCHSSSLSLMNKLLNLEAGSTVDNFAVVEARHEKL